MGTASGCHARAARHAEGRVLSARPGVSSTRAARWADAARPGPGRGDVARRDARRGRPARADRLRDQPGRWREARRRDGRGPDGRPRWVDALHSTGGTEMRAGIVEALRPLRADSQRQVVLVTDGYIGFEQEIVAAVTRDLPPGSRLHTIGVGSVNRCLTAPAARAGRGVEVIIGLDEEPADAARPPRPHAAPLLTDLVVEGSALIGHAPARFPTSWRPPALVAIRLRAKGGSLLVRGRTPAARGRRTSTCRHCTRVRVVRPRSRATGARRGGPGTPPEPRAARDPRCRDRAPRHPVPDRDAPHFLGRGERGAGRRPDAAHPP